MAKSYLLSSSPHVFENIDVRRLMLNVILALLPAAAYGVYLFGVPAAVLILTSVASCVILELLFRRLTGARDNYRDLSAVVTGLLLALVLPPSTPPWMVVLGALASIVVAKEFFGGLGHNPFNPALIGRAILLMSFPAAITTWHRPFEALTDAATTATPLNIIKLGGTMADVAAGMGLSSPSQVYLGLFLGNRAGCIGESSILLILVGAAYLVITGTIGLSVPLSLLASTAGLSALLGMDPLFGLLSGGVVFGAFFMATDYVTTPLPTAGKIVFGVGAGVILVLIRRFGGFPEGVTYGILVMNAFTPFLNDLISRKYGFVKGGAK